MKVVITGHASGIGKALLETFTENGQECIGFDILNGYDLRDEETLKHVIESCRDADVFINNALPNQSKLLEEIYNLWVGDSKVIINLSSAVTFFYNKDNIPNEFEGYYQHKQHLNDVCKSLTPQRKPYIMNVRPSWVNTQLVADVDDFKIEPQDLASLIYFHVVHREKYQVIDIVVR